MSSTSVINSESDARSAAKAGARRLRRTSITLFFSFHAPNAGQSKTYTNSAVCSMTLSMKTRKAATRMLS